MLNLRDKLILVISPQSWGVMFVSKHHYALELAKRGNKVYFLNPPEQEEKGKAFVKIEESAIHPNLFIIHHRLGFPFLLKFHALPLFHFLIKSHIRSILKAIGQPVDIVWSFDLGHLYPFSNFKKSLKVFHPVDEPQSNEQLKAAQGADIMFSVTEEILNKYKSFSGPKFLINHGVAGYFFDRGEEEKTGQGIHVGVSGNMLRQDIDRPILLTIIEQNPEITFEIWGNVGANKNLASNNDEESNNFITALRSFNNVILHGAVKPEQLAGEIRRMDAFLICYDVQRDQSKGTNYHKILEYLSTGNVVVSNNVSSYEGMPDLVQMVPSRTDNLELPYLLGQVIRNLDFYNRPELRTKRMAFAESNAYSRQIEKIEDLLPAHD